MGSIQLQGVGQLDPDPHASGGGGQGTVALIQTCVVGGGGEWGERGPDPDSCEGWGTAWPRSRLRGAQARVGRWPDLIWIWGGGGAWP